jgi:hypothetical protein
MWGCWEVDSLFRVRRRTRLREIGKPKLRNEEEMVCANRESMKFMLFGVFKLLGMLGSVLVTLRTITKLNY